MCPAIEAQNIENQMTDLSQETDNIHLMENTLMDLTKSVATMNLGKRTWFKREEFDCKDQHNIGGVVYIVNNSTWKKEVDKWTKSTLTDTRGDYKKPMRIEWDERTGLIEWEPCAKEADLPVDVGGNSEKGRLNNLEIRPEIAKIFALSTTRKSTRTLSCVN
jgi:hypothetical protein